MVMKKQSQKQSEFSEKDIESAILFLKTNTTTYPSRENAINYLRGMTGISHIIAHKIVKKEHKLNSDSK